MRGTLSLELFSGVGRFASAFREEDYAAIAFEIKDGMEFDLIHPAVIRFLCMWIDKGWVGAIWFGTPCTTWSIACRPAIRSSSHLWGLPEIPPHRVPSLELGNATVRVTGRILCRALHRRMPCFLENPDSSLLWQAPPIAQALRHQSCTIQRCTMGGFGARWRKATKVACWHNRNLPFDGHFCRSHGCMCQYSNKPHIVLAGRDWQSNKSWTSIASAYPTGFAKVAYHSMVESVRLAHDF